MAPLFSSVGAFHNQNQEIYASLSVVVQGLRNPLRYRPRSPTNVECFRFAAAMSEAWCMRCSNFLTA